MTTCVIARRADVLPQLERCAVLLAYALPRPRLCTCRRHPCMCHRAPGGIELHGDLHRLESRAAIRESAGELQVSQQVGRHAAGSWRCRVNFFAHPGETSAADAAIPYDGQHSRFVTLRDCLFDFGNEWRFHGGGRGETWPILRDSVSLLYLSASGCLRCDHYRGSTTFGVFTVSGTLTENGDFSGAVACRVPDPGGLILRGREVMSLEAMRPPDPGAAFLVLRALSALNSPDAPAAAASGKIKIHATAELRSAEYLFAVNGESLPLHAGLMLGGPMGDLSAEIAFDCAAGAGPDTLRAEHVYRFKDGAGRTLGTANASVTGGSAYAIVLPGASEADAFCYAGSGPLTATTGQLRGLNGLLSVTGSLTTSPAAISETALLTIFDSSGRLHEAAAHKPPRPSARPALNRFLPMVDRLNELAPQHKEWRAAFRKYAAPIASAVAARYNEVRRGGDFEGLNIDETLLRAALEAPVGPFNHEVFERYGGRALGSFKIYAQETGEVLRRNELYSYWDPTTYRFGKRYCKFITGSFAGFVPPWEAPDFSTHRLDPIVNSYREDVGVVSYIHVYQDLPAGLFQERTSFAYKMPGPHEVLWIVKDLVLDGKPAPADVFMTSHEWKDHQGDLTRYLMVGMFWRLDSQLGQIERANDVVWRALYTELPETKVAHEERSYVG